MIQFLKQLWRSLVFWIVALALFAIFRHYGIDEIDGISLTGKYAEIPFSTTILSHMLTGSVIGILYSCIDFLFQRFGASRLSLGKEWAIKLFVYLVATVATFTILLEIYSRLEILNVDNSFGWWRRNKTLWVLLLYIMMMSLVFSFIRIAQEKFGKGVFAKMLLGTYREPKEEKRIFMFIDLKDSTTIAEKLGHFKYSQLIQDCFRDLNEVIPKFGAEIYQYVGDEAVLSWPYEKGILNANCVRLFFEFQRTKSAKKNHYLEKYGLVPEFKAGIHGGTLMVAEVGTVKKELAYHGDVINTSARIQGACNTYETSVLISEALLSQLNDHGLSTTFLGNVLLKGKQKEVNIHTIDL